MEQLRGVRLKLDRADQHLAELEGIVTRYFDDRPLTLEQSYDAEASQWVVAARIAAELPESAGAVVGDCAHNIRSALDQLVYQLALLTTPGPDRTQFPIFLDRSAYDARGRMMVAPLIPEHASFIERLQPYHDDEPRLHPLHILNRLSNVDKHRHLHLANTALMGASLRIEGFRGLALGGISLAFGRFEDGSELARLDVYPDGSGEKPSMNVSIDGAFDLAVDDEGDEVSVLAGLLIAREYAGDVVDWFQPVFPAAETPAARA